MAGVRITGVVETIERMVEGLRKARAETAPKLEKVVEEWADDVAQEAKANLKRPSWLLTRFITSKVKNYDNQKIWAMAGFKFQEKKDKRDPGYYGQFHEAGWAPPGHKVTAPDHFLRRAKSRNYNELLEEVGKINASILEQITGEINKTR